MKQDGHETKRKSRRTRRNRVMVGLILIVAMSAVLLLFIFRFGSIVVNGHVGNVDLSKKTAQQYGQNKVIKGRRGSIFDVNGNVLAEDSSVYSIYAVLSKDYKNAAGKPLYVTDKEKTARVLSKYLSIPSKKILSYLKMNKYQVEFGAAGRNLSLDTKKKIQAEKLNGIKFNETPSRLYPNGTFASHIVGVAQLKTPEAEQDPEATDEKLQGILGIEKYFNKILAGKDGMSFSKQDSYGYELPNSKVIKKAPEDGSSVYLTLDSRLQAYLETLMQATQEKYQPKKITAVLMNAKTGKIVAAAQQPTFNASTKVGLSTMWRDSLVEDMYEPGSVFKLLTMSAAIDAGTYRPNEYYKSGSVKVADRTIYDWDRSGWGWIPFYEALPRSSNVGMVKIEQQLGAKTFEKYLNRFQVGEKTGITLPEEAAGSLNLKSEVSQATTAFGQGVNVTVMQMMKYLSAIADDGEMIEPQIVDHITSVNGKQTKYEKKVVGHPIKASTAQTVRQLMQQVVYSSYGTGSAYQIPGYRIAAKTGTAQVAGSNGQYLTGQNNYVFSVAGMAPANDPTYICYVTVQQPTITPTAESDLMKGIFNPLMKRALKLLDSDHSTSTNSIQMPKLTDESAKAATQVAEAKGLVVSQVGSGSKVVQQLPAQDEKVIKGQRVVLLTEGAMTMPNVIGWSKNDVLKLAEITGCDFKITGTGYATSQSVLANNVIPDRGEVVIKLEEPSN